MRVFVSHSHADKQIVERLSRELSRLVDKLWYSEWSLLPGDSIINKINEGIHESSILIVIVSQNSIKSRWVQKELSIAQSYVISGRLKKIIPIKIDDADINSGLPFLQDILYINLSDDYLQSIQKLKAALNFKLPRRGIKFVDWSDIKRMKTYSLSAWDIGLFEHYGENNLFWELDIFNKVAELYIDSKNMCALRIQLSSMEWSLLNGFQKLDTWKPIVLLREEIPEIAKKYERFSDVGIRAQYFSKDGTPSSMFWILTKEHADRLEMYRVMFFEN